MSATRGAWRPLLCRGARRSRAEWTISGPDDPQTVLRADRPSGAPRTGLRLRRRPPRPAGSPSQTPLTGWRGARCVEVGRSAGGVHTDGDGCAYTHRAKGVWHWHGREGNPRAWGVHARVASRRLVERGYRSRGRGIQKTSLAYPLTSAISYSHRPRRRPGTAPGGGLHRPASCARQAATPQGYVEDAQEWADESESSDGHEAPNV